MKIALLAFPLLTAIAAASMIVPSAAQAHTTRHELRHDVRVIHHELQQLARAKANHNWHRVKQERRDLAMAKRELREDQRDWHGHRR